MTFVNRRKRRVKVQAERAEPYKTCEAHAEGVAPEVFSAFVTSDGATVFEMENFEMGTLEHFLLGSTQNTDVDKAVDAALVELFYAFSKPIDKDYDCHEDLHWGNIALRRRADGKIEAKAIDWGMSKIVDKSSDCNISAFSSLYPEIGGYRKRLPNFYEELHKHEDTFYKF